jgi:hypothetical protein
LDALDALEVLGIVGHQREAVMNGGGADEEVEVRERLARTLEPCLFECEYIKRFAKRQIRYSKKELFQMSFIP